MNVAALRASFLAATAAEAERALAEARRRHEVRLAEARGQADELVEQARHAGEADGELEAAQMRVRARRRARALELAARREVYDEFRGAALEAALALRGTPAYARLLGRLAAAARRQLGAEAILELDPTGPGGVAARAGARRVDYTLPALVDRCIAGLGDELTGLWS